METKPNSKAQPDAVMKDVFPASVGQDSRVRVNQEVVLSSVPVPPKEEAN